MTSEDIQQPIDWARSFHFFVKDPRWVSKLLLGGVFALLSVVLVGAVLVAGYLLRFLRGVIRDGDAMLPDWNDWRGMAVDGAIGLGFYFLSVFVPLLLIPISGLALASLEGTVGVAHQDAIALLGALLIVGLSLLLTLTLWMIMFYLPAAFVRMAVTRRFLDGFALRANVGFIRRNAGNYLLALLVYLGAGVLGGLGYFLCCVGIFLTGFWSMAVYTWILGQVARRDAEVSQLSTALAASNADRSSFGGM